MSDYSEWVKAACAEIGVAYREEKGEPSHYTMRELSARICMRALRGVSGYVANSGDRQLNADFDLLLEVFPRLIKRTWNDEDNEILRDLNVRIARAIKKQKIHCPYTAEQYDEAVIKAVAQAQRDGRKKPSQNSIATFLGVDKDTLRKYGRPITT